MKFIDLTGIRFGRLSVIEKAERPKHVKSTSQYWLCKCDCGNEKIINSHGLMTGNTTSCGCYNKEKIKKALSYDNRNIPYINRIFCEYKKHSEKRNISFKISKKRFIELIESPCFYCGKEKSNTSRRSHCEEKYSYNGIDRIDSSKGYIEENIVPCCKICNKAKLAMPRNEFLIWIKDVYEYSVIGKII